MFNFKIHLLKGVVLIALVAGAVLLVESGEINELISYDNPYQATRNESDNFAVKFKANDQSHSKNNF